MIGSTQFPLESDYAAQRSRQAPAMENPFAQGGKSSAPVDGGPLADNGPANTFASHSPEPMMEAGPAGEPDAVAVNNLMAQLSGAILSRPAEAMSAQANVPAQSALELLS